MVGVGAGVGVPCVHAGGSPCEACHSADCNWAINWYAPETVSGAAHKIVIAGLANHTPHMIIGDQIINLGILSAVEPVNVTRKSCPTRSSGVIFASIWSAFTAGSLPWKEPATRCEHRADDIATETNNKN